jgi:hypothetical protein
MKCTLCTCTILLYFLDNNFNKLNPFEHVMQSSECNTSKITGKHLLVNIWHIILHVLAIWVRHMEWMNDYVNK